MLPLIGKDLTDVEIYINDLPSACVLTIYGEGTSGSPGAVLHTEDITSSITATSFNNITLSTPVSITGEDLDKLFSNTCCW